MPVGNVTASNSFQQIAMKQPAYSQSNTAQTSASVAQNTQTASHKSKKLPYVAAGVAIAALASAYVLRGKLGFGNAKKIVNGIELNDPARLKKFAEIKSRCAEEFKRILDSNTIFNEIKLDKMDQAAKFRALDKKRPDYLHEAANMAEEAYKAAYQKAKPESGKNILDKICFRITNESMALPEIYAQMPKEEAYERINMFTKSAGALDVREGMLPGQLFDKIVEMMEKVK